MDKKYKYIFGPVPSRRLGHSLGVDLVPYKVCTFDCIYCELGRTTVKTMERKEYYPVKEILKELSLKLKEKIKIDYITIAGSGEPTLYSKIKELITEIKEITDIPVAILTNSSLLWDKNVREDIKDADLIMPSLDAGDEICFNKVNRPFKDLSFKKIIEGLIEFSCNYKNKIWLEVLLVKDITANDEQVRKIAELTKNLKVDKIQLNTVNRPPAESFAHPISIDEMNYYKNFFMNNSEIINNNFKAYDNEMFKAKENDIINLVKRRPCSIDDISLGLQIHKNETIKLLAKLLKDKKLRIDIVNKKIFYCIN